MPSIDPGSQHGPDRERPGDPPLAEGERWTRAELAQLRRARWAARAWVGFLRAAQSRANQTRGVRPALARQERRWIAAGAGAWWLVARRCPDSPIGRAGHRGLASWGCWALMVDWHLGMLETPDGRPAALGPADALTLLRAWLIPAVAQRPAPVLLGICAATDLADGRVARATRCTRFGRDLESQVDACLSLAALSAARRERSLSGFTVALERARLLAGAAYATTVYLGAGRAPDPAVGRSGRRSSPLRVGGLIAAAADHRTLADRLLVAGSLGALFELLRGLMARRSTPAEDRC